MNATHITYFRFQPRGSALLGWTSEGSAESLPAGYVFAYTRPAEAQEWWSCRDHEAEEVVVFAGRDAYDPGDAEGVAVRPMREIERLSVSEWLLRSARTDLASRTWYLDKWLDLTTRRYEIRHPGRARASGAVRY